MENSMLGRLLIVWAAFCSPLLPSAFCQGAPTARWESLFDAVDLGGWKRTDYGGGGDVRVEDGVLLVDQGEELSGVNWSRAFPKMNYELELEAMRRDGLDFFCGLTFPVGENFLTLVLGGWGGSTVGISSIDAKDASRNETTLIRHFQDKRWYKIRVRVEPTRVQAWLDEERIVDLGTQGKALGLRPGEIEMSVPLGLSTFRTPAAYRGIRMRRIVVAEPAAVLK